MADDSLYTSPDVSSWRATLAEDPFSAMKDRHDLDVSVATSTTGLDPSKCWAWVTRQAHTEPCGLPIGADGICADGHRAA
jgi:hypothetical protein